MRRVGAEDRGHLEGFSPPVGHLAPVDIVAVVDLRDLFGNIVTAATAVTMASASTAFGAVTGVRPDASADPGRYTLTHRFAETTAADDEQGEHMLDASIETGTPAKRPNTPKCN